MSNSHTVPSPFLEHPKMLWLVLLVFWEQRKPNRIVKKKISWKTTHEEIIVKTRTSV